MTVALGLVCSDGVLVAADSMGSSQMIATLSQKVRTLDHCPAVWTAAGAVYVMEEVETALKGFDKRDKSGNAPASFTQPDPEQIRKTLQSFVHPAMKKAYESALIPQQYAPGQTISGFPTDFLFLGYANGKPWFLEFDQSGQINWHPDFYAIGSGGQFASVCRALLAHHIGDGLNIERGRYVAYRAIATTCDVSSFGVGLPVQIAVVDHQGARILDDAEMESIAIAVDRWKELEKDTLATFSTTDAPSAEAVGDLPTMADAGAPAQTMPIHGESQGERSLAGGADIYVHDEPEDALPPNAK